MVRHPLGGYGETGLRAGGGIGEALPYIEIDVRGQSGARVRGKQRSDVDRLIEAVSAILPHPPDESGLVGKISVRTDDLGEIANDEEFWPRIVLDLGGDLFIRARDPVEAQRFFSVLVPALKAGAFKDQGRWTSSQVAAGTVHIARMQYDVKSIQRVIAKIAWGLIYLRVGEGALWNEIFREARAAVINEQSAGAEIQITQVSELGTIGFWSNRHVAIVELSGGRLRAGVSLYGDCHTVDLCPFPSLDEFEPIVAFCETDGTRAFLIEGEESAEVRKILNRHTAEHMRPGTT